ncbi:MAG: aldehyde ferredoxin oxidoreductase N-terminal domain-containing protein, partial [Nitrospinota bacterium]
MGGWQGKILRVNLSRGTVKHEELNSQWARDFIGGRGLASKYLSEEVDPRVDPFSPRNKLIFATGPLTGTGAAANGRWVLVTKSPLTGAIACSNSGGYFPAELKFCGLDMIIFEGKSPRPVYLWVHNEEASLHDAAHLWGKPTNEVEDILHAETDEDAKIASIGPAGEKLVRFSCIMNDKHRAAGRSGVGAAMGSKNLKAVVVRGTRGVALADGKGYREVALDVLHKIKQAPVTSQGLPTYGTAVLVNIINTSGLFPTRN